MNQLLLGASIPFLVGVAIFIRRRGRASLRMLILLPSSMLLGMLWAVAPDLPRLVGMTALYIKLCRASWTNIFFWHYTIDQLESASPLYAIGLVLMMLTLVFMAWSELREREKAL